MIRNSKNLQEGVLDLVWADFAREFYCHLYNIQPDEAVFLPQRTHLIEVVKQYILKLLTEQAKKEVEKNNILHFKTNNFESSLETIRLDITNIFGTACRVKSIIQKDIKNRVNFRDLRALLDLIEVKPKLFNNSSDLIVCTTSIIRTVFKLLSKTMEDNWNSIDNGLFLRDNYSSAGRNHECALLLKNPLPREDNNVLVGLIDQDKKFFPIQKAKELLDLRGAYTAYLHLYMTALALSNPVPSRDKFYVSGITLLKDLGLYERFKLNAKKDEEILNELKDNMTLMGSFHVNVIWNDVIYKNRKKLPLVASCSGILWNIALVETIYKDDNNQFIKDLYFAVTPGEWAEKFLSQEAYINGTGFNQYGFLSTKILDISPYRQELAFKIALNLGIESRIKVNDIYTVKEVLLYHYTESSLSLVVKNSANYDRELARKIKVDFIKSLKILLENSYQINFVSEKFSKADLNSDHWLNCHITEILREKLIIKQPEATMKKLEAVRNSPYYTHHTKPQVPQITEQTIEVKAKFKTPKTLDKAVKEPEIIYTASELKALRIGLGITQEKMAVELDIPRSSLKHYENGSRKIPQSLHKKITQLKANLN